MVTATDELIVSENLLLFVSSKHVTAIWYQQWEVQSTCAGLICIGVVQTDVFTVISCKYVLLQYIRICIYICVCVYIYIYIYTHTHTYICMYVYYFNYLGRFLKNSSSIKFRQNRSSGSRIVPCGWTDGQA